ncbi:FabD/lysophospholipase-like protein [Aspergillus terreus]|uniref:FabD/lysophospholipase-like protein n=1 Tax=Aspergillus terreus TaxID=33178 RepID=A0A5M3YYX0_ASPTE|nr:hypothetical protein ATETN484_0005065700 [Aspergillus terreus]GFF17309.1 FabD/lysophospholipase-like protein [Aspergillus terreus]
MAERNLNILSLDGGGVRGISTLYILKEIMASITADPSPKPCDYFDMIGGTGSGGLIAILLGRLKMDIDECIHTVRSLYTHVFRRKRHIPIGSNLRTRPKFDSRFLEHMIKRDLDTHGRDEDTPLREPDPSCKVFALVTDHASRKVIPLTTYPSKYCVPELYKTARVWEACAACFAVPALFDPIPVGTSGRAYHDASLEGNNPMRDVWIEAKGAWPSGSLESQLNCMISIGAGAPSMKRLHRRFFGLVKTMPQRGPDADAETNKFIQEHSELDDEERLFRFDVPNGMADIRPDDTDEIAPIVEATLDYVAKELVRKQIRKCGRALM